MAETDEFPEPDVPVEGLDPTDLERRLARGDRVAVLDVRVESEYEEWHIEGANVDVANVPYFDFFGGVTDDVAAEVPEGDPLVVVCAKGGASEYVAGVLLEAGREAVNLAGGMNAWARLYLRAEVTSVSGPGSVYQYRRPSSGCLSYLVVEGAEAAVVDPLRAFVDRYVDDADELGATLTYAVDTHVHADHVSGVRQLAERTDAAAVLPALAAARGVEFDVAFETVEDGDVLSVGDATVEAFSTPGHTSDMTSYLVDDGALMTGDGLFVESVARPDLERGDEGAPAAAGTLYDTLHDRILPLPDATVVLPGHYSDAATPHADGTYSARLGELAGSMAALDRSREAFVEFLLDDMPPRPSNYEEIIATNLGRAHPDDEEAFELELGPNNCAATQTAMTDG
jgi:glyoxylase-like metal-dependent hydrolase (beta-lactamase superfamily II)